MQPSNPQCKSNCKKHSIERKTLLRRNIISPLSQFAHRVFQLLHKALLWLASRSAIYRQIYIYIYSHDQQPIRGSASWPSACRRLPSSKEPTADAEPCNMSFDPQGTYYRLDDSALGPLVSSIDLLDLFSDLLLEEHVAFPTNQQLMRLGGNSHQKSVWHHRNPFRSL